MSEIALAIFQDFGPRSDHPIMALPKILSDNNAWLFKTSGSDPRQQMHSSEPHMVLEDDTKWRLSGCVY